MLADSVVVPGDGKIYIQGGGWDQLNPPGYPMQIPRLGIAITISVPYGQTNKNHQLHVRLTNDDGENVQIGLQMSNPANPTSFGPTPLTQIEAVFNAGRPPTLQQGDAQLMPMALNLDGVVLEQPGGYTLLVEVDGDEVGRARFRAHSPVPTMTGR